MVVRSSKIERKQVPPGRPSESVALDVAIVKCDRLALDELVGVSVALGVTRVHPLQVKAPGLLFEYSIAAYWVRAYRAALDACNRLLRNPRLPPAYRGQTERNRGWCLAAYAGSNRRRGTSTHGQLSGPVARS
jgi:hypothetical protein